MLLYSSIVRRDDDQALLLHSSSDLRTIWTFLLLFELCSFPRIATGMCHANRAAPVWMRAKVYCTDRSSRDWAEQRSSRAMDTTVLARQ